MLTPKGFLNDFILIPENHIKNIEQKNNRVLKRLFIISLAFGLLCNIVLAVLGIFNSQTLQFRRLFYYTVFVFVGLFGLLLIKFKTSYKFVLTYALICLEIVFILILYETTIGNCLVCFLGLSFVYIMLLDVNPFVFTGFFVQALAVIMYFQKHNIFAKEQVEDSFSVMIANVALIFLTLSFLAFWKRKHVINDYNRQKQINEEQSKNEELLKNIFPSSVINQMKEFGVATAESYSNVTVFHSDIVDFTKTSSSLEPEQVINELNELFTAFDEITEKYDCMRVKTIGDAYIAVCGLPEPDADHAEKMIRCAQAIIDYLEERNKTAKIQWKIRCGVATGDAIAGVVGLRKYVYDIFGNAVDKAHYIEERGKSMIVAVSEETFKLVKDKFKVQPQNDCYYIERE